MRAVALSLMFACGARLPALPSQGGPAWIELRSPHFQLWTDADEPRARELVQQMEHFRSVIYSVAFPDLPPGGVTFVVALRDHRESEMFTPPGHPAMAFAPGGTALGQPMIVLPWDAYGDEHTITHELTHAISYNAVHEQPRWFAEGIATYFETIDLDPKRGTVDVGMPPQALGAFKHNQGGISPASFTRMFTCNSFSCTNDPNFYIAAWMMFAYLRNNYPKQLAQLEALFEGNKIEDIWPQVFPDHPMTEFGYEVNHWLHSGDLKIWSYKIDLQVWPVAKRALADADVHAVRGLLYSNLKPDGAGPEVEAALALDATNLLARAVEARLHHAPPSEQVARAIVKAHTTHWLAWQLLGMASNGSTRELAQNTMCKLVLQNPALALYAFCQKRSADQP